MQDDSITEVLHMLETWNKEELKKLLVLLDDRSSMSVAKSILIEKIKSTS